MSLPRHRPGLLVVLAAAVWSLSIGSGQLRAGAGALPPADVALARASAAAVQGRVVSVHARRDAAVDALYTWVRIDVARAWGFPVRPSAVDVKLLGGHVGDAALLVGGQARFIPGEEVLVFLEVRPRDGTLSVTGLERGKWTLGAGGSAATRQRHDAPLAADTLAPGDVESLAALAGTAVPLPATAALLDRPQAAPFPGLDSDVLPETGRWHDADWGAPVFVDSMPSGHPFFPSNGFPQLLRAIAAWSQSSALRLQPGVLRGPRCFGSSESFDGRISVSYDDPCDEIADTSPTLAIGGAFMSTSDVRTVGGRPYGRYVKGLVVLDNDRAKFARLSTGCYEEVLTHELGHAIGLPHATQAPAMMAATLDAACVERVEGAPLRAADHAALDQRYPASTAGAGPPGMPGGLTASVQGSTVRLAWMPTGAPATGYRLLVGSVPGASDVAQWPVGATAVATSGVATGVYYVRVVAVNAHGASAPSPDVAVVVGSGLPGAPVGLMAAAGVSGEVRVLWDPPRDGAAASYVLLVGRAADRPSLRIPLDGTQLHATGVASGTYFVRAVAVNGTGTGPASPEILVVVP